MLFEDYDGICYCNCVREACMHEQTPEQLLEQLNKELWKHYHRLLGGIGRRARLKI